MPAYAMSVPEDLMTALKARAHERNTPYSRLVVEALRAYLNMPETTSAQRPLNEREGQVYKAVFDLDDDADDRDRPKGAPHAFLYQRNIARKAGLHPHQALHALRELERRKLLHNGMRTVGEGKIEYWMLPLDFKTPSTILYEKAMAAQG